MKKSVSVITVLLLAMFTLSGCAIFNRWSQDFSSMLNGRSANVTSYDSDGNILLSARGKSIHMERNTDFDTSNSDGGSNKDSSVLQISVGDDIINHVGAPLLISHEDLHNIIAEVEPPSIDSTERGRPWLNSIARNYQNAWGGKSQTIFIYSDLGKPIAVYAGDKVEVYKTDIPKSTQFQVDGKILFAYRVNYEVVPTHLLK